VPVIAAAAAEQKDQHDDQKNKAHCLFLAFMTKDIARNVPIERPRRTGEKGRP
jgi:hypothetical protein